MSAVPTSAIHNWTTIIHSNLEILAFTKKPKPGKEAFFINQVLPRLGNLLLISATIPRAVELATGVVAAATTVVSAVGGVFVSKGAHTASLNYVSNHLTIPLRDGVARPFGNVVKFLNPKAQFGQSLEPSGTYTGQDPLKISGSIIRHFERATKAYSEKSGFMDKHVTSRLT